MADKDAAYKEQSKGRREMNQFKRKDKRQKKSQRSQSEFMPHANQYRRKKQQDREESMYYEDDLSEYI
jgi:hypothetical protein